MQTEMRYLSVQLTEKEWSERAEQLAAVCANIDEVASRKKKLNSELKAEDDELQASRKKLSDAVHSHTESRDVECQWQKNIERQMAYLVRYDTGEVIEMRALTTAELQLDLSM